MSPVTVAFTAWNRPHYMREVLGTWSAARGIGGTDLLFRCEPGCPEMVTTCMEAGKFARSSEILLNPQVHGVQRNPYEALSSGFARGGSNFVVLAEDDLAVSTDILEYFSWCAEEFRDDPKVLAVSARQQHERPGGLGGVVRGDMGDVPMMWVWGTWADRWHNLIAPDWTFAYEHNGWDWRLHDYWVRELGYEIISPSLSRCQHIGRYGGTHCMPEMFDGLQSRCFVPDVPVQLRRFVAA